jgi:hypothetical protein
MTDNEMIQRLDETIDVLRHRRSLRESGDLQEVFWAKKKAAAKAKLTKKPEVVTRVIGGGGQITGTEAGKKVKPRMQQIMRTVGGK